MLDEADRATTIVGMPTVDVPVPDPEYGLEGEAADSMGVAVPAADIPVEDIQAADAAVVAPDN